MSSAQGNQSNYFVHTLLRARNWQHRPQFDQVCDWWRDGGRGVCSLVGIGGAGKTAIADRFLNDLLEANEDVDLPSSHGVFVYSFYDDDKPENFFRDLQIWLEGSPRLETVLSISQIMFLVQQRQGLIILDGLEKVQESGARGGFGRLTSPSLRNLLNHIACGSARELSLLVTSRFALTDLRDSQPRFFYPIAVEEIDVEAGVALLRDRGVRGTDVLRAPIVEHCGRHALTVDLAGGYIKEYGNGDPATPLNLGTAQELQAEAEQEPDDDKRAVLKQGIRFARIAQRYREAMLSSDEAALALLERMCLFRLGVDCETLAAIFTGPDAAKVSGKTLAGLDADQLQKKLDWLVHMRVVEKSEFSSPSTGNRRPRTLYNIHPAVRSGFFRGIRLEVAVASHEAIRQSLQVSLGEVPGRPSDPATLDLLEEIVFHTFRSGHVREAWNMYQEEIDYVYLAHELASYERGERICRLLASDPSPKEVAEESLQHGGYDPTSLRPSDELPSEIITDWAGYLTYLGRLEDASRLYEVDIKRKSHEDWLKALASRRNLNDVLILTGRLTEALNCSQEALDHADEFNRAAEPKVQRVFERVRHARASTLRGSCADAFDDFRTFGDLMHEEPLAARRFQGTTKIYQDGLLGRLGRDVDKIGPAGYIPPSQPHRQTEDLNHVLNVAKVEWLGPSITYSPSMRFIRYDARHKHSILDDARCNLVAAREWALERDAMELFCWSALVQARIELSTISDQQSAQNSERAEHLTLSNASITEGLKIARDCGYGLYHIDLLLERARLDLLRGNPAAALEDIELALDTGIPANEKTGQSELLAANHEECGYAWAIPVGLQLRAEALLLRAAQTLGEDSYVPAKIGELAADVAQLIEQAKQHLHDALDRWHELRDPDRRKTTTSNSMAKSTTTALPRRIKSLCNSKAAC